MFEIDNINTYFVLFFVGLVGLCLGSFYNVVILRSLSGESIVFPPSKCPKCGTRLKWFHNIPVLSYVFLRGKCAFCREKISSQYPIVEIFTMLLFLITFIKFGVSLFTIFALIWISGLLIMTVTDLKEKIVDCNIAIFLGISGLIFNCTQFFNWNGLLNSILGLILGVVLLELIARLGYLFVKKRAMGEADTYIAGALGAILGWKSLLSVLMYSLAAAMIIVVPIFLYNRYKAGDKPVCLTSIIFILSVLSFYRINENWISYSLVVISGITLAILILKSLKNNNEHIYLPFVPALSAGALYFLFFVL